MSCATRSVVSVVTVINEVYGGRIWRKVADEEESDLAGEGGIR